MSMIVKRLLRALRDIPRAFFVMPTRKLGMIEMPSLIPRTMKARPSSERMSLKTFEGEDVVYSEGRGDLVGSCKSHAKDSKIVSYLCCPGAIRLGHVILDS